MWVNTAECEYCEYHALAALKQLERETAPRSKKSSRPADRPAALQAPPGRGGAGAIGRQSMSDPGAVARAVQLLKREGYQLEAPNPNSSQPSFAAACPTQIQRPPLGASSEKGRVACSQLAPPTHRQPSGMSQLESKRNGKSVTPAAASAGTYRIPSSGPVGRPSCGLSSFERSFGAVDMRSKLAERVLGAKPVGEASAREEEQERLNKKLKVLVKKDELSEKVGRPSPSPRPYNRCHLAYARRRPYLAPPPRPHTHYHLAYAPRRPCLAPPPRPHTRYHLAYAPRRPRLAPPPCRSRPSRLSKPPRETSLPSSASNAVICR